MFKVGDKVKFIGALSPEGISVKIGDVGIVIYNDAQIYDYMVDFDGTHEYFDEGELEMVDDVKTYKIDELIEGVEYECGGLIYKISDGLLLVEIIGEDNYGKSSLSYNNALTMEFTECEFNPSKDEYYYFPSFEQSDGYDDYRWYGGTIDNNIKNTVGVYRTKEQAMEKVKELGWI